MGVVLRWLPQVGLMVVLFAVLLVSNPREDLPTVAAIYAGMVAFSSMSLNLLLGARLPAIERLFGGMDKMFLQHRQFGYLALAAAAVHWLNPPSFPQFLASCDDLCKAAIESGEIGFKILMVLGLLSWARRKTFRGWRLPYQWWKWSHYGLLAAWWLAFFHLMQNRKMPVVYQQMAEIIGVIGALCLILYLVGWVLRMRRTKAYVVESVTRSGGVTGIRAHPKTHGIRHRAGQFAFIHAKKTGLREAHPFTISGGEDPDGVVQFNIKGLGDYTRRLHDDLAEGDTLVVEGPYGDFRYPDRGGKQAWIAAGIGITPFLSFVRSLPDDLKGEVEMVYLVRNETEAVGLDEFRAAADRVDNFSFTLHPSDDKGRWPGLSADAGHQAVLFCGPPVLRDILKKQFGRKLRFEYFEF
ncbi:ferric reductase-like transmembrane domain-containing protein [Pseudooceanicola onchidii]|uniref:ferredoxin reductase family protein n=1 Tax=Pseudooceanicola onchidii TaxID=2562279 RepID=UPI0010A9E49F|nr:ferredoxin reductase family protein [Pseudooceanicola onchidii]